MSRVWNDYIADGYPTQLSADSCEQDFEEAWYYSLSPEERAEHDCAVEKLIRGWKASELAKAEADGAFEAPF